MKVQRPQIVSMDNGLIEVRVRVPLLWWTQLVVQARSEAATAGQLIQEAIASLVPPDGARKDGQAVVAEPHRTRTGSLSSLSADQRRRAARGESIFTP